MLGSGLSRVTEKMQDEEQEKEEGNVVRAQSLRTFQDSRVKRLRLVFGVEGVGGSKATSLGFDFSFTSGVAELRL